MIKLPLPQCSVSDITDACIASYRIVEMKTCMENTKAQLLEKEEQYLSHSTDMTLYEIEEQPSPETMNYRTHHGRYTLKEVYKKKLSSGSGQPREYYDQLKLSAPNNICPICGQNLVTTLEHYLPESKYDLLAITPINLYPCCADCNKNKLAHVPNSQEEQTLHPYFDEVDQLEWLHATIDPITTPPSASFHVALSSPELQQLEQRLKKHFITFKLKKLYGSHAGAELADINYNLINIAKRDGAEGVKIYLQDMHLSLRNSRKNHWRTVLYKALSESNEFCELFVS